MDAVQVSVSNYTNAKLVDYTITLVPSVPIKQTNLILITFPPQMMLPENIEDLRCEFTFSSAIESVSCSYNVNYDYSRTVFVSLVLNENVRRIEARDKFSIILGNVRNPTTT